MSKQVDERVVSMQFDNKHFESNVKTTMNSLDKFNRKLGETENTACKAGFSLRDVWLKTSQIFEYQIAGRIVNSAKRIAKAFTIEPVMTGFNEYETKINAIQTIMSNTASKGTTMADVTRVLDELNTYADKTIYNFAEMTKNIGTFTAAGIGLEDSAAAIQGISNLAAASGSTSQQAATAMYQLSQALSTGTVRLMDWNSVVNAGMGGEKFQEALKATAREHGVAVDKIIEKSGSFRDSLSEEWLSAEILNKTLQKFTVEGAADYADAMVKAGKYTQEQADALKKEAQSMEDAATKVKTFTQLMDTLKESVQSGWAKTWEILVGDFEEAKEFFTGLSDKLGGVINTMSDARNKLLEGALSSPWKQFTSHINQAGLSTEDFTKKLKEVAKENGYSVDELIEKYGSLEKAFAKGALPTKLITETLKKLAGVGGKASESTEDMTKKLEKFQKVVNDVWRGDYANGEARVKALTEAGYKYQEVQDLVNKTVDGHKLTLEDLSEAQLKSVGYTDEQIATLKKLAAEAENTGTPLNELINNLDKPSGRSLLLESLTNALEGLGMVFGSIGKAWKEIFAPSTTEEKASTLYNLIKSINEFSQKLKYNEETAEKFVRTFKGVFAILDVIATLVMGPIKIAFKLLTAILGEFDLDILDVTAVLGDALVKFRDWVDGIIDFSAAGKKIADVIRNVISWFKEWFATLKESDNIPRDIVKGLINGLGSGLKAIGQAAMNLGKKIIEVVKNVLGIHSPSTEFFEIGTNIIKGLVNGIMDGASWLWNTLKTVAGKIVEIFGNLDWGTVLAGGLSVGTLMIVNKLVNVIRAIVSPMEALGELGEKVGRVLDSIRGAFNGLKKMLNAFAFQAFSKALINLAIAVGILVAAIVALTLVDQDKLWSATGVVLTLTLALTGVLVALSIFSGKMGDFKESFAKAGFVAALGFTLLAIAGVVAILGKMKTSELIQGVITLGVITILLIALMAACKLITKNKVTGDSSVTNSFNDFAKMLRKIAWSLIIISFAIKIIGSMKPREIVFGTMAVLTILVAVIGLMAATRFLPSGGKSREGLLKYSEYGSSLKDFGTMLRKIAVSLLIIAAVVKIFGSMPLEQLKQGGITVGALLLVVVGIMAATRLLDSAKPGNGYSIKQAGNMFKSLAVSLLLIAAAIKIFGKMPTNELIKGGVVIAIIIGVFVGIMAATKLLANGEHQTINAGKVGGMMLGMSASLLIIAMAMKMFAKMSTEDLFRGGGIVLAIMATFIMVMSATRLLGKDETQMKYLTKVGGMMLMFAGSIAILAAAMFLLTLLKPDRFIPALVAVAVMMTAFAGVMAATRLLVKSDGEMKALRNVGTMMLMLAGAVAILAAAMFVLTLINPDRFIAALAGVIVLMGGLVGVMAATKLVKIDKGVVGTLVMIVISLAVLMGAIAGLAFIKPDRLKTAALSVAGVIVALAGLIMATKLLKVEPGVIKTLVMLTIVIAVIAGVVIALAAIDPIGALLSCIGIALIMTSVAMMMRALGSSDLGGSVAKNALKLVGSLVLVLAGMALVLALMSKLETSNAISNAAALSILIIVLAGVAAALSVFGSKANNIEAGAKAMMWLTPVVLLLGLVLKIMSGIDPIGVIPNAIALSVLLVVMALVAERISAFADKATKIPLSLLATMGVLTAIIYALSGALAIMNNLNPIGVIPNAIALSALLIAMSYVAEHISAIGGRKKGLMLGWATMGILTAVVLALSGALAIMSTMNPGASIVNAIALSLLLVVMTLAADRISTFGHRAKGIAQGSLAMAALSLALVLIASVLGIMSTFDATYAIPNAVALAILLGVLTGVAGAMSLLGQFAGNIALGSLALGVLAVAAGAAALVLALMEALDIQNGIANAQALSILLLSMSAVCVILSVVGAVALGAIIGIGVLLLFIAALGGFLIGIGALVKEFPMIQEFLGLGISLLIQLAEGIGSVIGAFIKGFATEVMQILPAFGQALTDFMTNASGFVEGAKKIDVSVLAGVGFLSAAILLLSAASFVQGILSFLSLGFGSFAMLGLELSAFMTNAQPFFEGIKNVPPEAMTAIGTLAEAILMLTAANLLDGIARFFSFGENSLSKFGEQIVPLGTSIGEFIKKLKEGGVDGKSVTLAEAAAGVIKTLAETADSIPNSGGWLGAIVGDNDIGTFGTQLAELGASVVSFITPLSDAGINGKSVNIAKNAAQIIVELAKAADEIPNSGGWWESIVGGNDIGEFADNFEDVGKAVKNFVGALKSDEFTLTAADVEIAKHAANIIVAIAEAAEQLPSEGNWWTKLWNGDQMSIEDFGTKLPALGSAISKFLTNVGTLSDSALSTAEIAVDFLLILSKLAGADLGALSDAMANFGEDVDSFATDVGSFAFSLAGISAEKLASAKANLEKVLDMLTNFAKTNTDTVTKFGEALKSLGDLGIQKFTTAFGDAEEKVKAAGKKMVDNLVSGASDNTKTAVETFKTIATKSADALEDKYQNFYDAGSYLVDGFADGISENDYKATAKAAAMAKAAAEAAEAELDINSPSKVFRKIGTSIPEGFAQGIDKFGHLVSNSSTNMADVAVDGVKSSISNIADAINSDIDAQPTIRPVLDLSDVRSGASAISGLLGLGSSIGVSANARSISSMMNNKNQNGVNDDVVSAINKLRNDIGSMEHASYTINGITYDDGSNIADAVSTLVRAAKVERRT